MTSQVISQLIRTNDTTLRKNFTYEAISQNSTLRLAFSNEANMYDAEVVILALLYLFAVSLL